MTKHNKLVDESNTVNIGHSIKVFLPGESPWATVTAKHKDGRVAARIDNDLVFTGDNHGYKKGDVVTFERHPEYNTWELSSPDRQLPTL